VLGAYVIPIGNNGGGDQLCLCFDVSPPAVAICLHDEDFDRVDAADSFGDLIDALRLDPDAI
jgi:hypothetical protein